MKYIQAFTAMAALALTSVPSWAQDEATETALSGLADTFARGFYARDAEQVLSTVHPELSKLGLRPNFQGFGPMAVENLTPGDLLILGEHYNADGRLDPVSSTVDVRFFDTTADVGVFQLTADTDWYDFFLGTRINGEWVLVNCAYGAFQWIDNPDRETHFAQIREQVEAYAAAWDAGDAAGVVASVYPDFDRRHVDRSGAREFLAPETLETIAFSVTDAGASETASQVTVFEATRATGAARIDAEDRTEWVFLLRVAGEWRIVNSFWAPA
ncbi:nuclear transport factor 2 family protein [Maricaulis parjimensis]|uniref:nuclear transport factor 2 family protein n=1 Tax=Maricaulis parjimensis TaxID=144023 RepID=UPI0019396310|nr:nuclear transport factor 2 family protein [Maricaulis parjimensis]